MTPEQEELVERVRAVLAPDRAVHEVPMFGGVSFMVGEAMVVAAGRDGTLLVRADPGRHDELAGRPGAAQAVMGTGRKMGPSWIRVDHDALVDDGDLASWIAVAMDHHARQSDG